MSSQPELQKEPTNATGEGDGSAWSRLASATTPSAFCSGWLAIQCGIISDVRGGIVLLRNAAGDGFEIVATWPEGSAEAFRHLRPTADHALTKRHGVVLPWAPQRGPGGSSEAGYHVAYPVDVGGELVGAVALDLSRRPRSQLQSAMRMLQWGAGWLQVLSLRQRDGASSPRGQQSALPLLLLASACEHPEYRPAATSCVTELAAELGCDRVGLGLQKRRKMRLQALSHTAQFSQRTNLVRAIESAMDESFDQEATVNFPAASKDGSRITRAHAELAQYHGSGAILSVPFRVDGIPRGVFTLERTGERPFNAQAVELCEVVAGTLGPLLELKRRDRQGLLSRIGTALVRALKAALGRQAIGKKIAALILVGLVVFFALARAEYRVSAKSVLEGLIQRSAVAPFEGYVKSAPFRAGDTVKAGDVLCVLDDRDFVLEKRRLESELEQITKQYHQALAERSAANARIFAARIEKNKAQQDLVEEQLERTRVVAPFDGVVVTGDLSQSIGAPVERGAVLFEIAPLSEYRLVLDVDERDITEVTVGQRGSVVLSAFPEDSLPFRVEKITPVSSTSEGQNFFRVEGQLEGDPDPRVRPGLEGIGKIEVEERLLIWIWTHRAIDWLRLKLWSWLP